MQLPQDTEHPQDTITHKSEKTLSIRNGSESSGESEAKMFCTACGTRNTPDANFCKQCGRKMSRTAPLTEEQFALAAAADEQVRELMVLAYRKYEVGDLEAAIHAGEQALDLKPNSTDAHSLMSTLYEKQGNRDLAIAEREKVLALNPGSIADREKLDELRDGARTITPLRINSSRRIRSSGSGASIFATRAGAALAAVSVTLLILLVGTASVLMARARGAASTVNAGSPRYANLPLSGPQSGANQQANLPATNGTLAAGANSLVQGPPQPNGSAAVLGANGIRTSPRSSITFQQPPAGNADTRGMEGHGVRPATVQLPQTPPLERVAAQSNSGGAQPGADGTYHLPDNNGLSASELGPPPNTNVAQPPARNTGRPSGRIEIVVSPGPARGSTDGGTPNRNSGGDDGASSSMDSRSQRQIALQHQLAGRYQQAVSAYIKALDGAGDDAASIHQQIGLCYQRLDEKESAVAQYQQAISAYKELAAAGRNVETANRGIRACEAGIRACQ